MIKLKALGEDYYYHVNPANILYTMPRFRDIEIVGSTVVFRAATDRESYIEVEDSQEEISNMFNTVNDLLSRMAMVLHNYRMDRR